MKTALINRSQQGNPRFEEEFVVWIQGLLH